MILKVKGLAIASMIVNFETVNISFFGIDHQYRNLYIVKAFLEKISEDSIINKNIRKHRNMDCGAISRTFNFYNGTHL